MILDNFHLRDTAENDFWQAPGGFYGLYDCLASEKCLCNLEM